jgi:threonylcarbamoyladenosine tRNA methylthiotransferase MtaB
VAALGDDDRSAVTRVYLHTFGCKANQYDSEVVRQALAAAGASVVGDPRHADAAVVNSCTVTHTGEAKMRGLVRRLARRRPGIRTVVMGCAAAVDDGAIGALPGVVGVVPGADHAAVLAALMLGPASAGRLLQRFDRGSRAWLKVQDGCDEHCTFCATVIARGASRSRPVAELVAEAALLARHAREIVLTGVHIGTYGRDLPGACSLGILVDALVAAVPAVRFRLSSVEATEIDERLVDLMAARPDRLAPHVHAPLQSGSDAVLKRMGRHWYTSGTYRRRLEGLAKRLPVLGLGADVIVGFPGETDADHRATRALVADLPFTYLHVFPYSERPEAAARRLGSPVAPALVRARSAELRMLAATGGAAHADRRHGGIADVVLLDRRRGRFRALTEDYLTVDVTPTDDEPLPARFRARLARGADGVAAMRIAS